MPETVICTYRVKPDQEEAFRKLLDRHWPALREAGLVTDEPSRRYRGEEDPGREPFYVEIFTWLDAESPERAHESPAILAVWEPMGACCEARHGRPAMEFPHVTEVDGRRGG